MSPSKVISRILKNPWIPGGKPHWFLKPDIWGASSLWCRAPEWGTNFLLLRERLWPMRSLPTVWCPVTGKVFGKTFSLPLLPIPLLPCGDCCSASFQFFFIKIYSICHCISGVPMGGGELRVFLCHHLGPLPSWGILEDMFLHGVAARQRKTA